MDCYTTRWPRSPRVVAAGRYLLCRERVPSHRRDCHSTDALSQSILKHLLKAEGVAAEWQSREYVPKPDAVLQPKDVTGGWQAGRGGTAIHVGDDPI